MSNPDVDFIANTAAAAVTDPSLSPSSAPAPAPAPAVVEWPEGGALTRDWVAGQESTLDWCSRHLLADRLSSVLLPALIQRLVLAAAAIQHRDPNLVRVDPRPGQAVVVVEDVPGQDRIFVFNGDYVDRGAWES